MYKCESLIIVLLLLIKKTFMFIIIYFKNRIRNLIFALQSPNDINIL